MEKSESEKNAGLFPQRVQLIVLPISFLPLSLEYKNHEGEDTICFVHYCIANI